MRFDLLALTGGQGVSMAVCPVQTCLALNLYLSGSCLPNDFTITLSRLQAVFERTEHQIFCLVIHEGEAAERKQTARVTCNILRLCLDIKYNISITISGQLVQVPS